MRVIFAGTPVFAATALKAIIDAGFNVSLVLTQPDRPSGRGMKLQPSAVKQVATAHHIPVAQPISLRLKGKYPDEARAAHEQMSAAQADVMVVAAYGLILPSDVLSLPRMGCVNIHASLLPRWRGAAPIHRAIEAGDAQTGITLMRMDEGLDTGAMLATQACAIAPTHTTATLHDELGSMGAQMIVDYLRQLAQGVAPTGTPQPEEGVCYAEKISKAEARIDWTQSASTIARKIRALDPAPACVGVWSGESFKIWAGQVTQTESTTQTAGAIVRIDAQGVTVACGQGTLLLTQLQKAGGKRAHATQVAQSLSLCEGGRLE